MSFASDIRLCIHNADPAKERSDIEVQPPFCFLHGTQLPCELHARASLLQEVGKLRQVGDLSETARMGRQAMLLYVVWPAWTIMLNHASERSLLIPENIFPFFSDMPSPLVHPHKHIEATGQDCRPQCLLWILTFFFNIFQHGVLSPISWFLVLTALKSISHVRSSSKKGWT